MTPPFTLEALHEAGHAVIARLLGLNLTRVWITSVEGSGGTNVRWPGVKDPQKFLRILAGARACIKAFELEMLDEGFDDEVKIDGILDGIFSHDDGPARIDYMANVDREVDILFMQQGVRAAAWVVAKVLIRKGEIEGPQAEILMDQHLNGELC